MQHNEQRKRAMDKLYKKHNGLCAICNCKTQIQKSGVTISNSNTATFGHIYEKTDLRRLCFGGGKYQLECFSCNNAKDRIKKKAMADFYNSLAI